MFIELIDNKDRNLIIKYSYNEFSNNINKVLNDNDIIHNIIELNQYIDCTLMYNNKQINKTIYYVYDINISLYYYYLTLINNQFEYMKWFNKLFEIHYKNIEFERELNKVVETKHISKPKTTNKNKYVKQVSIDMFTNETSYIYSKIDGSKSEVIISSNPNLLKELNSKPKTNKKSKVEMIKSMTFSFKKK